MIGNAVEDGASNGAFVCEWDSEPEQASGSLLLQPLERELCVSANDAVAVEGFAEPGVWSYDTAFNIPGGHLTLCLDQGFATVVVTGGIDAEDDEATYRSMAEEIMKLVLGRLQ